MQVNLFIPGFLSHLIITQYIMKLSPAQLSLIILGFFSLLILIKYILTKKNNNFLSTQLSEANLRLEKQGKKLNDIEIRHNDIKEFQKSIDHAELTTKFQSTRLKAAHANGSSSGSFHMPEKYSYIRSLSEKGMSSDEIAAVLSISPQEASQLVTLTMIKPAK